jgi:hypothetical protein
LFFDFDFIVLYLNFFFSRFFNAGRAPKLPMPSQTLLSTFYDPSSLHILKFFRPQTLQIAFSMPTTRHATTSRHAPSFLASLPVPSFQVRLNLPNQPQSRPPNTSEVLEFA